MQGYHTAVFDLDGTLTDSMYVWDRLPEELVRQFGGIPAPDLSHTLRAMELCGQWGGTAHPPGSAPQGAGSGNFPLSERL